MHIPGPSLEPLRQLLHSNKTPGGFTKPWCALQNDGLGTPLTPIICNPQSVIAGNFFPITRSSLGNAPLAP